MSEPVLLPVNWQEVKMLALVVGVREAARQMGLSEEQVKKRCTREGWLATPEARIAVQRAVAMRSGTSAPMPLSPMSPAQLVASELSQLGSKTRLSLARGIAKAGEHIESMDGQEILMDAQNVKFAALMPWNILILISLSQQTNSHGSYALPLVSECAYYSTGYVLSNYVKQRITSYKTRHIK